MRLILECSNCGHSAAYHTGVGKKGYNHAQLSCRFETDRYEICTCDHLTMDEDKALSAVVQLDLQGRPELSRT